MLWNDFLTLTLIPTLIHMENGTIQNRTEESIEDPFPSSESIDKSDTVSVSNLPSRLPNQDPLLAKILEEEKRLNLAFPDDYFDHLEDKSEEVRDLIRTHREAIEFETDLSNTKNHDDGLIRSRSDLDEPSTQYPILTPETDPSVDFSTSTTLSPPPHSSSRKPKSSNLKNMMGNLFDRAHTDLHAAVDIASKPLRNLFGRQNPITTTPTAPKPIELVPEQIIEATTSVPTGPLNCTQLQTEYNGQCYNVLQQYPCSAGNWLIENPVTNKGKCVENKCATTDTADAGQQKQNLAWYGGECIFVSNSMHCHLGMRTIIYKSGLVDCDCKEGHLYSETDGNCYPAYRQGPCSSGQYFVIPKKVGESTSKAICMPNPCLKDGYFCNSARCPRQRNCVQLGTECGINGNFTIHPSTNTPTCIEPNQSLPEKIIGNVPTLSCAPGTRRDILGNCRTPADITFS